MRLIKWIGGLLLLAIVLLAAGVIGNRLPLSDPPGTAVRLYVYLNTHEAKTMKGHPFAELRLREYALPPAALLDKVKAAIQHLARWEITAGSDEGRTLHAVVTSALFRFKDDVDVTIAPSGEGKATLDIRAVSRVGKGDLGTNTRHVLDVYDELEKSGAHGEVVKLGLS